MKSRPVVASMADLMLPTTGINRVVPAHHRASRRLYRCSIRIRLGNHRWNYAGNNTDLEAVFRSLKSELGLRPIHHRKPVRAEGHLFITWSPTRPCR